ncbi:MAG: exodeoxyribonuclease VII large subunit [Myxococcales bacterium]|nr:exodeoxyribonuclease VII large subunit [Myxococcales bacterium]
MDQDSEVVRSAVLTVTQLTKSIKTLLEGRFDGVSVEGEIFTFKRHTSGHLYFSLKDDSAQLTAVMFRAAASRIRFNVERGLRVVCTGRITVYEPQGNYQMVVDTMTVTGDGHLLLALEQLKQRLFHEGLFDPTHKKKLPLLPRRVGIVTSPTGAAIRDMLRILFDRFPVSVLLYPTAVQGQGAAAQIARGIAALDQRSDIDVIIIGRGGGSLEDLWAFNEEIVARAVFAAQKPIVSAVGHEVDFVISDFVADVRAPTPTGAAEMVVPRYDDLIDLLHDRQRRIERAMFQQLRELRREFQHAERRLSDPRRLLQTKLQRLDDLANRAESALRYRLLAHRSRLNRIEDTLRLVHPARQVQDSQRRLAHLQERLERAVRTSLSQASTRIQLAIQAIRALGPEQILHRGYAIVRRSLTDEIVRTFAALQPGDELDVTFAEGSAAVTVSTTGPEHRPPKGNRGTKSQRKQLSTAQNDNQGKLL